MQSYDHSSSENYAQPLDFTSKNKNIVSPILDLSCKKRITHQDNHATLYNLNSMSLETRSLSPSRENNTDYLPYQSRQISCGNERKSPFEVRTFMVTPPSESDSPKKSKFHSTYTKGNFSESEDSLKYSTMSMDKSSLPVSSILSNAVTSDNFSHIPTSMSIASSPSHSNVSAPLVSPETSKKAPRPFKAYPKDPLSMSMVPPELIHDPTSNEVYNEFRKQMLESVRKTNKGTNIKMRRISKSPALPTSTMDDKDSAYWERRRKNNEAAKRSRDARRAKEDEIAIRAAFLERENMQLKCEVLSLRSETAKLRCMVYSN